MKFLLGTLSVLLTLSSTHGSSTFKRQLISADTLIQDVTNIHNGVLANQAATAKFEGGNVVTSLVEGTPVIATVGAIHIANRKGFLDANLSGPINAADTRRIVDHTINTVGNSIPNAVNTIVSKKENFVQSGQRGVVLASLKLLLNDHDTFSAALLAKTDNTDPAVVAKANGVVAKIHDAIQGGINAYST